MLCPHWQGARGGVAFAQGLSYYLSCTRRNSGETQNHSSIHSTSASFLAQPSPVAVTFCIGGSPTCVGLSTHLPSPAFSPCHLAMQGIMQRTGSFISSAEYQPASPAETVFYLRFSLLTFGQRIECNMQRMGEPGFRQCFLVFIPFLTCF